MVVNKHSFETKKIEVERKRRARMSSNRVMQQQFVQNQNKMLRLSNTNQEMENIMQNSKGLET